MTPYFAVMTETAHPIPGTTSGLIDQNGWQTAQATNAVALADAGLAVGRLDQLIAALPEDRRRGALTRLALIEVEAMLWGQATPLRREEIGRDLMEARASTDLDAMKQARWAIRRLEGQTGLTDLRAFLALHRAEGDHLPAAQHGRPTGRDFDESAGEFLGLIDGLADLHPIARACPARIAWRLANVSAVEDMIEGAVWTGRAMAANCEALTFLPLGRHGRRVWLDGSAPAERMARHLDAVTQGAVDARRHLSRLSLWAEQARAATATIKGNSPSRIIDALLTQPLMTTAMVEEHAGISRDTAERMLQRLQNDGLVREVTGTRRFRLWSAAA
ncbi:DUF1403 family protein [Paracoccus sp. 11-3]|uniref:DUF1403 family protein n=1 Tax=Paracoccus amoyensis TaxID=2760093 RepID=A0A926GJI5_9RHOB|nr:helix-turn-helix domain-containing protein [Paracoccus amoyensis]MBC9248449.1 DUF1403 family protein [Paracoccus amoyensis]